MTATITQVVKQFQQEWTGQLESDAILAACRGLAYRWRERTLDPVTTIQLFFVRFCTVIPRARTSVISPSSTSPHPRIVRRA